MSKIITFFCILWLFGCGGTTPANAPEPEKLTVDIQISNLGAGRVFIEQLNKYCVENCKVEVVPNSNITFTAEPQNAEYNFDNWGGACEGSELTCTLDITSNVELVANFTKIIEKVSLTVEAEGNGVVHFQENNVTCNDYCIYSVNKNTTVVLEIPEANQQDFLGWSSDCLSESYKCTLIVTENKSIKASFNKSEDTDNSIEIKNINNSSLTNTPIQIGRVFKKGEFVNAPMMQNANKKFKAQTNIKQRYDDGSVKHAIFNLVIDEIQANEKVKFDFIAGNIEQFTPFDASELLDEQVNFDAQMVFTFNGDQNGVASARQMLQRGDYQVWLDGPVASTILIADHSEARVHDIGSDEHRSVRPIFEVTFWRDLGTYSVRFTSEIANTSSLQDQFYDIELFIGKNEQQSLFKQKDVTHPAKTRWTKKFHKYEMPDLDIDHNLKYLISTYQVPNYDLTKNIPDEEITRLKSLWNGTQKNLLESGFWTTRMGTAGGRPDIGIYPSWVTNWLYTSDNQLAEIALTQSELSGGWPIHLREGDGHRYFDFDEKVSGIGKITSIAPKGRPTMWSARTTWHEVDEEDKIYPVGDISETNWVPDVEHHPDLSTLQYLLTGQYYFLEQQLFSAAWLTSNNNAKAYNHSYGRGPTASTGAMYSWTTRGHAWHVRTRAHTISIIPDGMPEKKYFLALFNNAIALWEGIFELKDTDNYNSDLWKFGRDTVGKNNFNLLGTLPTLNFWEIGIEGYANGEAFHQNPKVVQRAAAPWMSNFLLISFARSEELGLKTSSLKSYLAQAMINYFEESEMKQKNIFHSYVMPTVTTEGWIQNWREVEDLFTTDYLEYLDAQKNDEYLELEHGYDLLALAASAYVSELENGKKPWEYYKDILEKKALNNNPKWAILPRKKSIQEEIETK